MKLLVTNDDGFDAPGIASLANVAGPLGDLVVVAPALPQSGIGHQVTAYDPILVAADDTNRYRVHGTPADCSRIGLREFLPDADWVIAGINNGGNLGVDVYMSGTVAAAREAALLGYRAMAVSHYIVRDRPLDWALTERRITPILKMLLEMDLPQNHFWNVNLPHPTHDRESLPHTFCDVDSGPLDVRFERQGDHYSYSGDYHARPRQSGRDVDVCFDGHIAISKVPLDVTNAR
ncbi:MAG: 5'/3'-nucleotidase SurE [Candidatus Latescibacteria bacterium]|jgi:5'-nucleotidase|nr:5'/3'-nucleotidase SurE [Candidatus Latescibacterota bacterium]